MVTIRDPCTGNTLVQIREPKVKIKPYQNRTGIIDLNEHIENRQIPVFFKAEPPLDYSDKTISWGTMLELIKSKKKQAQFWEFVGSLRDVRLNFNKILMGKFGGLSKTMQKNEQIDKLFTETRLNIPPLYDTNADDNQNFNHLQTRGSDTKNFASHEQNDRENYLAVMSAATGRTIDQQSAFSPRWDRTATAMTGVTSNLHKNNNISIHNQSIESIESKPGQFSTKLR